MINYKSYKASCSKGTDSKPFLFVIFYITVVSNAYLFNVPCFYFIFKEEHTMLEDMKKNLNLTFTEMVQLPMEQPVQIVLTYFPALVLSVIKVMVKLLNHLSKLLQKILIWL